MKNLLLVAIVAIAVAATSCKKTLAVLTNTPVFVSFDQSTGASIIELPNGARTTVRAIVNPSILSNGVQLNAEAIMVDAPIRPASWQYNSNGQPVAVGFDYNEPEFSAYRGSAWVVECQKVGGIFVNPQLIKVTGEWGTLPNPSSYMNLYAPGTYRLVNYSKVVSITKMFDYPYAKYIIN